MPALTHCLTEGALKTSVGLLDVKCFTWVLRHQHFARRSALRLFLIPFAEKDSFQLTSVSNSMAVNHGYGMTDDDRELYAQLRD